MKRTIRYRGPHKLAVHSRTKDRHEDIDRGTLWTDSEISWLMENYAKKPIHDCAHHLRRSEAAVIAQYHACHEAFIEQVAESNFNPGRLWQSSEIEWLKANFEQLGVVICAQRLTRSPHSVRAQAERLGLKQAKAA